MDARLHPIYFGSMSVCLNIPNFAFVYIDYDFPKYDFSMLISDSSYSLAITDLMKLIDQGFKGFMITVTAITCKYMYLIDYISYLNKTPFCLTDRVVCFFYYFPGKRDNVKGPASSQTFSFFYF